MYDRDRRNRAQGSGTPFASPECAVTRMWTSMCRDWSSFSPSRSCFLNAADRSPNETQCEQATVCSIPVSAFASSSKALVWPERRVQGEHCKLQTGGTTSTAALTRSGPQARFSLRVGQLPAHRS